MEAGSFTKPRDIRADAAWRQLVDRLNQANPPIQLKTPLVLDRDIEHTECTAPEDCFLVT